MPSAYRGLFKPFLRFDAKTKLEEAALAKTVMLHVENGSPIRRIVRFSGLSHEILLHPIVTGEPTLTAQAFYYLDDIEYVAKIQFEYKKEEISDEEIDYLVDNYLFEFSRIHHDQNANAKADRLKFWSDDPSEFYLQVDNRNTQSLAIDASNDPDVRYIRPVGASAQIDLSDWDIGRNCARGCLQSYIEALSETLDKKVSTFVEPSPHRDGYLGLLRVIRPGGGLLDFSQAMSLEYISIRSIGPNSIMLPIGPSSTDHSERELPVEHVSATNRYEPVLLSHYFSGLKEVNPLKSFVGFYNVLEYFFGEVPTQSITATAGEKTQLTLLIKHLFSDQKIRDLIRRSEDEDLTVISSDLMTSSGVFIQSLNLGGDACADIARWLYDIRCAVMHSKKSRRGQVTASFQPYSTASNALQSVVPIMRWLAAEVMAAEGTVP